EAKARFFEALGADATKPNKAAIINMDDARAPLMRDRSRVPVIGYGIDTETDWTARSVQVRPEGVSYEAKTPAGVLSLRLQLTGRFNVYNSLAAAAVGRHEGVPLPFIRTALEQVPGIPGRLERIDRGQPFTVLVDYAHSPDSLENVLNTCRSFAAGRVIVVFGAGGDRDKEKRPVMGELAAHLADVGIITSPNPRGARPEDIARQIEAGVLRPGQRPGGYENVIERRDAIRRAIEAARPGDIVLIAGKGHETTQEFHDRSIHFDDREEAARALKERFGDGSADAWAAGPRRGGRAGAGPSAHGHSQRFHRQPDHRTGPAVHSAGGPAVRRARLSSGRGRPGRRRGLGAARRRPAGGVAEGHGRHRRR